MSLDDVLTQVALTEEQRGALRTLLLAREDEMATQARLYGQQFGMFPGIVAEVIAQIGLGTPPTTEERLIIHNNFHAAVEQIRRMLGEND